MCNGSQSRFRFKFGYAKLFERGEARGEGETSRLRLEEHALSTFRMRFTYTKKKRYAMPSSSQLKQTE